MISNYVFEVIHINFTPNSEEYLVNLYPITSALGMNTHINKL